VLVLVLLLALVLALLLPWGQRGLPAPVWQRRREDKAARGRGAEQDHLFDELYSTVVLYHQVGSLVGLPKSLPGRPPVQYCTTQVLFHSSHQLGSLARLLGFLGGGPLLPLGASPRCALAAWSGLHVLVGPGVAVCLPCTPCAPASLGVPPLLLLLVVAPWYTKKSTTNIAAATCNSAI